MVPGMKVMLLENLCTGYGLVNGSIGILNSLDYELDTFGKRVARCAYVAFENYTGPSFDECPAGMVPVLPTSSSKKYRPTSHSLELAFTRAQLPLIPAYAFIDYKAQGQTIKKAIIDIASSQSLQGAYVMLSRIGRLEDMAVLRHFESNKIRNSYDKNGRMCGRRAEDGVEAEFLRLEHLCAMTTINYPKSM